ncbi:MAG: hypothetical protein RI936_39 [Pseudomonadota bacterium]|jgi:metal-responsive CopG/Arc/MetJ family transcriptional regulator
MARKQIGIRLDETTLAALDRFIEAQELPVDRTAVIETAVLTYLEAKRAKGAPPTSSRRK